jgi:hypothetical protein
MGDYQVCRGVKILPLRWRRHNGEWFCFPEVLGSPYLITQIGDYGYDLSGTLSVLSREFKTVGAAVECAERDYKMRVMSALDISEVEGREEE